MKCNQAKPIDKKEPIDKKAKDKLLRELNKIANEMG